MNKKEHELWAKSSYENKRNLGEIMPYGLLGQLITKKSFLIGPINVNGTSG